MQKSGNDRESSQNILKINICMGWAKKVGLCLIKKDL